MFNKDYIMRIIEQFVQALLAIVRARKAGKHDEAYQLIIKTSQRFLDSNIDILILYEPDQLLKHFTKEGRLDAEQCIICADLFYEIALISEAEQNHIASSRIKQLCLHLYTNAVEGDIRFQTETYKSKIKLLTQN